MRVTLAAGQRCTVRFTLAAEQLAFTGVDGSLRVEPGRHRVMVGTSSVDLPCQADLEVFGALRVLPARERFMSAVAVSAPWDGETPGP